MMSDDLPDSPVKHVAKIFEIKFDQLDRQLKENKEQIEKNLSGLKTEIKERIEKSDDFFDKKISSLENKIEKRESELTSQKIEITSLKSKSNISLNVISGIIGAAAAIIIAIIQRLLGV